jgi:RNA polymerase sigma factor (sigma-70 family)
VEVPLLQLGEECRAIEDKTRGARFRDQLRFRSRWAARPDDLLQALHEDDPTVLHFSGHGAGAQGLCFLADDGSAFCVSSDSLAQVIRAAGDSIKLIVLNACYTKVQAEALVTHVPCVIGMPDTIGDKAAIVYAAALYRALAFGESVARAHQWGLAALSTHSTRGQIRDIELAETALHTPVPVVLTRTGVDAEQVYIIRRPESAPSTSAMADGTRVHLEITIDTKFETVDAETVVKIVMDFCRLAGGQPVKIICATKGSLRLNISFTPEAARIILNLRNSGQLTEVCGFKVTSIVELGPVETATQRSTSRGSPLAGAYPHSPEPRTFSVGVPKPVPGLATSPVPRLAHAVQLGAESEPALTLHEDLEAVLVEIRPTLLRLAERLCGDRLDAEDVLQETFMRAMHRMPSDVSNVSAWLTTTLRNVFVDHSRRSQRRPSHEPITDHHGGLAELERDQPDPEWGHITIDDIRSAADTLEPVYRDVYRLHTFEELTYKQIAERLGIEPVTVGVRLNRARKKLRDVLMARFGLRIRSP